MKLLRTASAAAAAAMLLGTTLVAEPASAQGSSDCGQLANSGDQTFTYIDQNRSNSAQHLAGLINAAISNVEATVPVTLQNLQANVSVVCVSDSLNNNHLEILKNINVDVIDDVTIGDVNVLAIDVSRNLVYVAPATLNIGQ